jgi:hypothetical protein
MLERNEQLIKEMEIVKVQNNTLREQVSKYETDLNDAHVCIKSFLLIICFRVFFFRLRIID